MYKLQAALFAHKFINCDLPKSFLNFFTMRDDITQRVTTSQGKLLIYIKKANTETLKKLPVFEIPKIWNEIVPFELKSITQVKVFKEKILEILKLNNTTKSYTRDDCPKMTPSSSTINLSVTGPPTINCKPSLFPSPP